MRDQRDPVDQTLDAAHLLTTVEQGAANRSWVLDPAIELDQMFEQALWDQNPIQTRRWLTPQAPLEPLANATTETSRWVDFLFDAPGLRPTVIEIDGTQHASQRSVDERRDAILRQAGMEVIRVDGPDFGSVTAQLIQGLGGIEATHSTDDAGATVRSVLAPSEVHRFGFAIVEAVSRGFLVPGERWVIDLVDELGVVAPAAGTILDLLDSVARLWGVNVVPAEVSIGNALWTRGNNERFTSVPTTETDRPQLRIVLDAFLPPHASLPDPTVPSIVIRHAYLPVALAWVSSPNLPTGRIELSPTTGPALHFILEDTFGFTAFREGQLESVISLLAGHDRFVMLPTGSGKSLIYQLAGLLQPGPVIVVDPLVSLIDDQRRRLEEDGIDRAVGLHRAAMSNDSSLLEQVGSGDVMFAFITPERLQVQGFRKQLRRAAELQSVGFVVIDEAHCVSEWGHDFRTSYLRLGRNLRAFCSSADGQPPPVLALTATASPAVLRDVLAELELPESAVVRPSNHSRPNLRYHVVTTDDGRFPDALRSTLCDEIPRILDTPPEELFRLKGAETKSGIIFTPHVNGKFGVETIRDKIAKLASDAGAPDIPVYSGSPPKQQVANTWDDVKRRAAHDFVTDAVPALVATKAFGMGIDKPNIRYTVHAGISSSIEAFAQESGRAGRDGHPSACVLLASLPSPEVARQLLDLESSRDERHEYFTNQTTKHDLDRQLFFHYNSYGDPAVQTSQTLEVFDELDGAVGPGGTLTLTRTDHLERCLHRLAVLGVVDDYTVAYGANSVTVSCAGYTSASIRDGFVHQARQLRPGDASALRIAEHAPTEVRTAAHYFIEASIKMLFDTIEPARLYALSAMYRLAADELTGPEISARIAAYLGDGPLASVMAAAIDAESLSLDDFLRMLEVIPPDADLWLGAAARQLEVTPGHPVPLLVDSMGEAWSPHGAAERFLSLMTLCFAALPDYGVSSDETVKLLRWVHRKLTNPHTIGWRSLLWMALPADDTTGAFERAERGLLRTPNARRPELAVVLGRRLHAINALLDQPKEETWNSTN